jgi:hypothetical protein
MRSISSWEVLQRNARVNTDESRAAVQCTNYPTLHVPTCVALMPNVSISSDSSSPEMVPPPSCIQTQDTLDELQSRCSNKRTPPHTLSTRLKISRNSFSSSSVKCFRVGTDAAAISAELGRSPRLGERETSAAFTTESHGRMLQFPISMEKVSSCETPLAACVGPAARIEDHSSKR